MEAIWTLEDLIAKQALLIRAAMRRYRRLTGKERRETSLTELLIEGLREHGRGLVSVAEAPGPEAHYGADLELWLRGAGYLTGLRLQAKSLHPRKSSDGVYKYLHHPLDGGTTSQVTKLISNTSAPLNPGYLYYNGLEEKPQARSACCSVNGYGRRHGRLGLTFSGADVVQRLEVAEPRRKSLDDVLPESVPLKCLVSCPRAFRHPWWMTWPVATAVWPVVLAGGRKPWVARDPYRRPSPKIERIMSVLDPPIFQGQLPPHLLELLEGGEATEEFTPTARFVAVIDGDAAREMMT
ncbi:DUF6615 family protein [Micromonospora zamorensis]|uniref:DUF6615 family protein n=1 Tax=Micromonospora zamorensis TaxID=709883 RepID=UPI0033B47BCE